MIKKTEAVIIGAGPAGAVAAQRLASAGVKVMLIDKENFPRDKTCGDGVSSEGLKLLERSGLGEWSKQFNAPEILRLSSPGGIIINVDPKSTNENCYGRTIQRKLLDAKLVEIAVEAGAELVEGVHIKNIEPEPQGVKITGKDFEIEAEVVILAEGTHAVLGRKLGLVQGKPDLVAVRQYFENDRLDQKLLEIHFSPEVIPGYSWIFPEKGNLLNIGSGTTTLRASKKDCDLNKIQDDFVNWISESGDYKALKPITKSVGMPLRTNYGSYPVQNGRILIVGEGAGLVSPITGEGITPAMESGEIAAECIINAKSKDGINEQSLQPYQGMMKKKFSRDWRAAHLIHRIYYMPRLLERVFRNMAKDEGIALLVSQVILGYYSPQILFKPKTLFKLLV